MISFKFFQWAFCSLFLFGILPLACQAKDVSDVKPTYVHDTTPLPVWDGATAPAYTPGPTPAPAAEPALPPGTAPDGEPTYVHDTTPLPVWDGATAPAYTLGPTPAPAAEPALPPGTVADDAKPSTGSPSGIPEEDADIQISSGTQSETSIKAQKEVDLNSNKEPSSVSSMKCNITIALIIGAVLVAACAAGVTMLFIYRRRQKRQGTASAIV